MKFKKSIIVLVLILLLTNIFSFKMGQRLEISSGLQGFSKDNFVNDLDKSQADKLLFLENYINSNYLENIPKEELYEGQLKGMVKALNDPYSEYLTKEEYEELMEDTSGKFYGIGVYIGSRDGFITVIAPIKNTPAEKAGLLPGDVILKIDGVDISGDNPSEASNLIRGKKDTKVNLTILRASETKSETFDVEVVRDEVKILTVESEYIDENILYISISQFNENTYNEFKEVLDKISKETKGIILDLRSNPGGLLSTSTKLVDELLPEGLIVYTESKNGRLDDEIVSDKNFLDLPIVTLVNSGSASASEIVAGALKDHNRTILVGENTFGKGVVQTVDRFSYGDGIKLTISEYFTPNGNSINGKGIKPDIEVKLNEDVNRIGIENIENDNQLQKAIEEIRKQI